jgi:hypothetical protein
LDKCAQAGSYINRKLLIFNLFGLEQYDSHSRVS